MYIAVLYIKKGFVKEIDGINQIVKITPKLLEKTVFKHPKYFRNMI